MERVKIDEESKLSTMREDRLFTRNKKEEINDLLKKDYDSWDGRSTNFLKTEWQKLEI